MNRGKCKKGKGGKRRLWVVGLCLVFLVGCASTASYKANIYNGMQTAAEVYNASLGTFRDLNDAGQLSAEDYAKGRELFIEGYDLYQKAVEVIVLFEKGQASEGQVDGAISAIQAMNKKLKEYLADQLKKRGVKANG